MQSIVNDLLNAMDGMRVPIKIAPYTSVSRSSILKEKMLFGRLLCAI
jgi:hypothetical protein